jgi:hypothetical protein
MVSAFYPQPSTTANWNSSSAKNWTPTACLGSPTSAAGRVQRRHLWRRTASSRRKPPGFRRNATPKMIKRNGGCLEFVQKNKIPHPRNQTRPRRSPREILQRLPEIHPRQSIQPWRPETRIFEKIEMKWFTQKEMEKNIHIPRILPRYS